jgi:hypothetical protein
MGPILVAKACLVHSPLFLHPIHSMDTKYHTTITTTTGTLSTTCVYKSPLVNIGSIDMDAVNKMVAQRLARMYGLRVWRGNGWEYSGEK